MKPLATILTVLAGSLVLAGTAKANPEVYEQTLRSAVWVISPIDKEKDSFGSGALVSSQRRLVVTNFHVVEKRPDVVVFFPARQNGQLLTDPRQYIQNASRLAIRGKVIHTDQRHDLAVIQLERLPNGVRPIALARQSPRPGQAIHAVGSSGVNDGTLWRYSKGEVRQVYQRKGKTGNGAGLEFEIDTRVVESQIPSNKGDSGGPVVNNRGELVAITQGAKTNETLISFAIDVEEVQKVLNSLGAPVSTGAPEDRRVVSRPDVRDDLPEDEPPARPVTRPAPATVPTRAPTVAPAPACHPSPRTYRYSGYTASPGCHSCR